MKDAGGLFFPNSESVRSKNPNDIEVACHEIAHWLEKEIARAFEQEDGVTINGKKYSVAKGSSRVRGIWISGNRKILTEEMQQELRDLDYDQREKQGRRNYEGFAEYFRMLLSGHDMEKHAPNFHKFFMEKLLGNKAVQDHFKKELGIDILYVIDDGKKLFTKWYGQGSLNRFFAHSGLIKEKKPVLSGIRAIWEKVENFFHKEYDELHALEMEVKEINKVRLRNGLRKLSPSRDPFIIATAEKLSHQKIAQTLINDRVINHNAEELFVVKDKGDTSLVVGSRVTQREIDIANKEAGGGRPAIVRRAKTLIESFAPITEGEMNGFVIYGIALRSKKMHERGLASGMDEVDIEWTLENKEHLGYRKEWDQAWKDITEWHEVLLDWLVDAGRLSAEAKQLFQAANPVYLPFKRAIIDDAVSKGFGGDVMTPSSLKAMRGSHRELLNPFEAMEANATAMIALAIKSRILKAIADVAPEHGMGDLITRVPGKARVMNTLVGPLKKQLTDLVIMGAEEESEAGVVEGIEALIDAIDDEEVLRIFYRDMSYKGSKENPVVPIFRNGKIHLYEVNKELYQVIIETTKFETDIAGLRFILKIFRPFASLARLGWTGLNVKFNLWTNPMRDIPLASVYTKGQSNPFRFVGGVVKAVSNWTTDDLINIKGQAWNLSRRYTAGGGNVATINGMEQSLWQAQVGQLNLQRKGINKTLMFLSHPIKGVSSFLGGIHGFLSATELGPRITEFEGVYTTTRRIQERAEDKKKRGKPLTKQELDHLDWTEEDHYLNAKVAGKDITFNFTKTGKWGKLINQAWPFHNATMQGPNKAWRFAKEHPIKFLYRSFLFITMPAMLSWYLGKDEDWYKNIEHSYNNLNLFFSADDIPGIRESLMASGINPKDKIFVFPIPHETGILFGSIPRAALDEIFLKRKGALWESLKDAFKMILPGIAKVEPPAIIAPWRQVQANESHFGRHITPPYMKNSYRPRLPEDQAFPWTSRLARAMSRGLQKIYKKTGEDGFDLNPIEIDHLFKQYTGGLATQGITFVEDSIWGTKSGRSPLAITLRMPHRPNRQIALFYLELNELEALKGGDKASGKQLRRLKEMKKFKKDKLDDLNKRKRKIGIPIGDKEVSKVNNIDKKMGKELNRFLGRKYKDLKR